ncbi:MAG: hypothetical protein PHD26_03795 [Methanosarcinaceae archaeon]|nr:hypothetical protein [Methanosarcinaceae archaeon]
MAGGQPVFIVDPKKEQTKGKDSLSMNIAAAKAVASIVKSTLGPRGMDKMLVQDSTGSPFLRSSTTR